MATTFHKLSTDWSAEPNAPHPLLELRGDSLILIFDLNPFEFPEHPSGDWAQIVFDGCWRYRLGATNDEGWYAGRCRFSGKAPEWGEFYEVSGDLLEGDSLHWIVHSTPPIAASRHFLFYLRDETFECDCVGWNMTFHQHPRMNR